MTAFARPSLRSSSRHITGLDALPATDIQHHHGKRTRDALSGNRDKQPFKRQKIHAQDFSPLNSRNRFEKDFPVVPRKVGRPPLTHLERSSRHPDRVPLPSHNVSAITTIGKHSSFSSSLSSTAATKAHRPGVEHDGLSHKIDKRNLRSHDGGSRSKSELALYFPNYDELLSIEAKDPGNDLSQKSGDSLELPLMPI